MRTGVRLLIGAFVALTLVSGCRKSGRARLEGKWRGSRVEGVEESQQVAASSFAVQMELVFKGEEVSVRSPSGKQTANYEVTRDETDRITIITDRDGADHPQVFTVVNDHTIQWRLTERTSITFLRE